jgi:flagella basal body P-ring formation protein FlgA
MKGSGNCSSTNTDPACEVPSQVPTETVNPMNIDAEKLKYQQAIKDYQEAEKKAEDAKTAFKTNPNSETKFKAEMAIRDKFSKKTRLDHRKTMLTNTLRLRKKGGRRLKHRKTHKKRWASRTTLRRS